MGRTSDSVPGLLGIDEGTSQARAPSRGEGLSRDRERVVEEGLLLLGGVRVLPGRTVGRVVDVVVGEVDDERSEGTLGLGHTRRSEEDGVGVEAEGDECRAVGDDGEGSHLVPGLKRLLVSVVDLRRGVIVSDAV